LYTTLEEASRTGVPLFRPLLLNYQQDSNTLNIDDQFMIGTDLLVAPIIRRDMTSRMVYLPQGTWIDYWTRKRIAGGTMIRAEAPLDIVPMFVRAGAIIPMGPEMNYVGEKPVDPITFAIYPDDNGPAATTLYEDDGVSPAYRQGVFRRTQVSASRSSTGYQIDVASPQGNYNPGSRNLVFIVKSGLAFRQISVDGKPLVASGVNETKSGWYKSEDGIGVRIPDDGKAHKILAR
jgi:alpha-glucosidase